MRRKKQNLWLVIVVVTAVLSATGGMIARADGCIIPGEQPSSSIMADQKAVIVYGGGREDLVISVGLDLQPEQGGQEMAWLIPVPSRPEVQVTDEELFHELDRISAPEIVYETEHRGGFSWGLGAEAMPPPAVQVLERKQVGIYDVAVLSGREAAGLLNWLHDEGFYVPDTLQPALEAYIAEGWVFVAMRIAPEAGLDEVQNAQPVWLSFDTDRMIYPMRLTAVHGEPLALRLYVLADHRYELKGFTVEFAGLAQVGAPDPGVPDPGVPDLGVPEPGVLDPALAPMLDREFFFTKLFNQAVAPAEMAEDLYPYQAATDEPYREQQVYTYISSGPGYGLAELACLCGLCWLVLFGLLVLIVVAIVLLRRRKTKTSTS